MSEYIEFLKQHPYLTMAAVGVVVMWVMHEFSRVKRAYQDVDPQQLTNLVNREDAVLVDVREPAEYREAHIVNSRHIPLGSLSQKLDQLEEFKDKPVVVYCRSGNRSASACSILTRNGFGRVYNLAGGIMAWQSANMPVKRK